MLEDELAALEALRELLADGLARHARAGEPDERVRLGEDDVPERRERCEHAAGRRVSEEAEVREPSLVESMERPEDLRHLHERERALLHPRAAGGAHDEQRYAVRDRALGGAGELLPHHAAHRAAHEVEVHDRELDRALVDLRGAADRRVLLAALRLRLANALRVPLLVGEREGVSGRQLGVVLGEAALIDQQLDALARAEPEVVLALRADVVIPGELLVEEHLAARRTLGPQGRRDLLALPPERP